MRHANGLSPGGKNGETIGNMLNIVVKDVAAKRNSVYIFNFLSKEYLPAPVKNIVINIIAYNIGNSF